MANMRIPIWINLIWFQLTESKWPTFIRLLLSCSSVLQQQWVSSRTSSVLVDFVLRHVRSTLPTVDGTVQLGDCIYANKGEMWQVILDKTHLYDVPMGVTTYGEIIMNYLTTEILLISTKTILKLMILHPDCTLKESGADSFWFTQQTKTNTLASELQNRKYLIYLYKLDRQLETIPKVRLDRGMGIVLHTNETSQ